MPGGFAALQPAMTARITFQEPIVIGTDANGSSKYIALINKGGTLKSEPGFFPAVDAELQFGTDHFSVTSDMRYCHIDVKAALKNKDGAAIGYAYKGIIEITPEFGKVFAAAADATTVDFGLVFTHVTFQTGAEQLKALEAGRFVGTSRFILEPGKPQVIEMKISKIVKD